MVPASCAYSFTSSLSSVDLPMPLGPITTSLSPRSRLKVKSLNRCLSPKLFVSPSTRSTSRPEVLSMSSLMYGRTTLERRVWIPASSFSISFTRDCAWLERLALAPKRATKSLSSPIFFFFCAASASDWRLKKKKIRSEEHTSELQSHVNLVCRLLLEKKKQITLSTVLLY